MLPVKYLYLKKIMLLGMGFFLFLFSPQAGQAEELVPGQRDDIPLISQEQEDRIDDTQVKVSEYLVSAATWFDSFFDDGRYEEEANRTQMRLKLSTGIDRHNHFEFKPRISLRLHVPKFSRKLNLTIFANDDEDFDVDTDPGDVNSREDEANVTAALRYFFRQSKAKNISTSAGVSFKYVYIGLRYRGSYDYGIWQGRLTSRLRYYTDDGWESKNRYDIERPLSDKFLFRTTVEGDFLEEERGLSHGLIFSLYQALKIDRALHYDIGTYFDTRPNYHMTDTVIRVRYRQRFYRDWLVFEVAPQISFPEEYDREVNPGIIFRLEAEFGYASYEKQIKQIFSF